MRLHTISPTSNFTQDLFSPAEQPVLKVYIVPPQGRQDSSDSEPDESHILCQHGHEWVVFSTNISFGCLMVQCVECGAFGTVDDPSKQEWSEAYDAPSRPYRWNDVSRVTASGTWPIHVIRATGGPKCECYSRGLRVEPGGYERFPAEIMGPLPGLNDEARAELLQFADIVETSDMCGGLFAFSIRCFEEATWHRHTDAASEILDRLERADARGLHCSPGVVARVLREFAGRGQRCPSPPRTKAAQ